MAGFWWSAGPSSCPGRPGSLLGRWENYWDFRWKVGTLVYQSASCQPGLFPAMRMGCAYLQLWRYEDILVEQGTLHQDPQSGGLLPASWLPQCLFRVFQENGTCSSLLKTSTTYIKDFSVLKKMETLKNKYTKECNKREDPDDVIT